MSDEQSTNDPQPAPSENGEQKVNSEDEIIDFGFYPEIEAQNFYHLRDLCLSKGTLFRDPIFRPEKILLKEGIVVLEWKRPGEIVPNPQFIKDGYSRFDVKQNILGDCWFLAGVAILTSSKHLFFQVVPEDQSFEENYAGIFHFRFWQFQRWVDVVIDDLLPVYDGKLMSLQSSEKNEFWSALLEKAYAKLIGSYEALDGGIIAEAMQDFTGGVCETYCLQKAPSNLFEIMLKAYERGAMMGCSPESIKKEDRIDGIVSGHAYSITKVVSFNITASGSTTNHQLIRIRNPWGNKVEWIHSWSDGSKEWSYVSEEQKKEIGLTRDDDGEFWMSYEDFLYYFLFVDICSLNPESQWAVSVFQGKWMKDLTAGGRPGNESYYKNPQYHFTLKEVDEGDKGEECTIIVDLMQNRRQRSKNKKHEVNFLSMSFHIWKIPDSEKSSKPHDMDYFKNNNSVAEYRMYEDLRGITRRFKLPRGTYCLVPSTSNPDEEGEFFLRIFSEHEINMKKCSNSSDDFHKNNKDQIILIQC